MKEYEVIKYNSYNYEKIRKRNCAIILSKF